MVCRGACFGVVSGDGWVRAGGRGGKGVRALAGALVLVCVQGVCRGAMRECVACGVCVARSHSVPEGTIVYQLVPIVYQIVP